jgi:regulator of protease activity HflC (stomatin/prohibitin superfamily)
MGVILGIIIGISAVVSVGWLVVMLYDIEENGKYIERYDKENNKIQIKKYATQIPVSIILSIIGVLAFIIVPFSFTQIETGEVAVVKVWGKAQDVKGEGLNFDLWISTQYVKYDLKTQETNSTIQAYSQDAQQMTGSLTVQFRIQADKVLEINKQFGTLDVLIERIKAISEEKAKVVLAQSSAMSLIENRATLSASIEESIKSAVTQYHIDVTMVALSDIEFSETFEQVVEQKMIAEQEKLKAEYEKEKAIIQAEQALEVAKKEAEAKIAQAQAEAQAIEELAQAEANAIKTKSIETARMLGFKIVETTTENGIVYNIDFEDKTQAEINVISEYLKYIEYLSVWSGDLPDVVTGDGVSIMIPTP